MDPVSEWFPTLTQRISIITPQGYEWLGDNFFRKRVELYTKIKDCYDKDLPCIEDLLENNQIDFTHIYIYKPSEEEKDYLPLIRYQLLNSQKYKIIFENSKTEVFSTE